MRSQVLHGKKIVNEHLLIEDTPPITIVNYDILAAWLTYLQSIKPQLIVVDECHYVADRSTKRTKALQSLCLDVPHIIALSGTPLVNRPAELWPILNIIRPTLFPSFFSFAHSYCGAVKKRYGWEYKGATRTQELNQKLDKNLMIRRRKADVLKDLPAKRRILFPVEMDDSREYQKVKDDFLAWYRENKGSVEKVFRSAMVVQLGYLRRVAAKSKMNSIVEWIENWLREDEEKLIVFAYHKSVIKRLRTHFIGRSIKIDGSTSHDKRRLAVKKFQRSKEVRLFIGQMRAAGVGLDGLQVASSDVAFIEFDWTPGVHLQCEGRAERIGQTKPITAYYLPAKGTIEEKIVEIVQKKQEVLNAVLDGGEGEDLNIYDLLCQELEREPPTRKPSKGKRSCSRFKSIATVSKNRERTSLGFDES